MNVRPSLPPLAASNRNHAFARALVQELAAAGVRHVCLCPGSRSAPLAVAVLATPGLRRWVHVDERAAAFFALGLAKAATEPVALVCTSGTAAANFLPAVVEASLARVPLVVLTADRPPEVRDWGAPQTIDQVRLYGTHARWFAEAPPPEPGVAGLRYARALGARAVAEALGSPPGPVHLNLPFREPLDPVAVPDEFLPETAARAAVHGRGDRAYTERWGSPLDPSPELLARLVEGAGSCARVVVACGPSDPADGLPEAVARLARRAGWPVLAEPTSQVRAGLHVAGAPILAHASAILRDATFAAAHQPDWVLQIGAPPTSKAFHGWLAACPEVRVSLIDRHGRWADPAHHASEVIAADPARVCALLENRLGPHTPAGDPRWLRDFLQAEKRVEQVVAQILDEPRELLPPRVARELFDVLPEHACLYVANSMAVRDVDAFFPVSEKPVRVLANRGANGIDGTVSCALGAAAAGADPLVLLTGDLAFVHDLGGLLAAARHGLRATLVVVNDDGGGIFSQLPIAAHGEQVAFEELFRVRHGLDLGAVVRAYGAQHQRVSSAAELRTILASSFASDGVQVIEVAVDPRANLELRHRLADAVAAELGGERPDG